MTIHCPTTGKIVHASKAEAKKAMLFTQKRKGQPEQNVFPCPYCKGWHFGGLHIGRVPPPTHKRSAT